MKETKLLNCPFCGGNNVGVWTNHPVSPLIPYSYEARCYDCHFGLARSNTKDEAIKAWNTRKPMERILERLNKKVKFVDGKITQKINWGHQVESDQQFMNGVMYAATIVKEEGVIE